MTDGRSLHPLRASALGAAAIAAIVVACETPPPAPVAPTATSSVAASQSRAKQVAASTNNDSLRQAMTADLMTHVPAAVLHASTSDPLLMVHGASGQLLRAVRLAGVTKGTRMPIGVMGVDAESIESVDVVKGDWLPTEARGGVIRVTLKPKGLLPKASDVAALSGQEKTWVRNEIRRLPVVEIKERVAERPLSKEANGLAVTVAPLVEIRDAENRLLYSKPMESAGHMTREENPFADVPAAPDDIARVEVTKPAGVIRIWLKPGAALRRAK